MKLGSHNTFTYLPVKQWYFKPFAFMSRCQEVDIWQQYFLGARLFDLRVRFDDNDNPIICHGLAEYKHLDAFIDDVLKKLNKCKGTYVRVVLELYESDTSRYRRQETLFRAFCKRIQSTYTNIIFFGGNNRNGFSFKGCVYSFENSVMLNDKYSSTTSLFKNDNKFLRIIDDVYPRYYAKKYNKKNIEEYKNSTEDKWLFIDFVNLK